MNQWESQIRTNLEDPVYANLLNHAIASAPGLLAAGLVNVRYAEGCLRLLEGKLAPEAELTQLILLTQGLFPPSPELELPEAYSAAFAKLVPLESAYWTTESERLFVQVLSGGRALVLSLAAAFRLGPALLLVSEATGALRADPNRTISSLFQGMSEVLTAALLDTRACSFKEVYVRPDNRSEFVFDDQMANIIAQFFGGGQAPNPIAFTKRTGGQMQIVNAQISSSSYVRNWWAMPFDPGHLMFVLAGQSMLQGLVSAVAKRTTEDTVRVWADGLLAWGIDAILEPFPKTQREFLEIIEELRRLHQNDLIARLRIGGFANYSMGEGENIQRCQECIYYHPHRKWCDLPELPIPVEPHWWCRLWKL